MIKSIQLQDEYVRKVVDEDNNVLFEANTKNIEREIAVGTPISGIEARDAAVIKEIKGNTIIDGTDLINFTANTVISYNSNNEEIDECVLPITTYFPDGMRSNDDTYDSLTATKAIQRIASDGTTLEEPIETLIDPPLDLHYVVENDGTESITAEGTTSPFKGTVEYVVPDVDIEVVPQTFTENGTYTAAAGTAYSPVTVNVPNPSIGKLNITDTQVKDVSTYAEAQIVDENLVAENIKNGVTILGVTGTYEGGGGQQPQLFAPVITGGVNEISWANDTRNGGFEVTIAADVDGVTVTSPLTITEEMDGSTLTITASAENFASNSAIVEISFMTSNCGIFTNKPITKYNYVGLKLGKGISVDGVVIDDAEYVYMSGSNTGIQFTGYAKFDNSLTQQTVSYVQRDPLPLGEFKKDTIWGKGNGARLYSGEATISVTLINEDGISSTKSFAGNKFWQVPTDFWSSGTTVTFIANVTYSDDLT